MLKFTKKIEFEGNLWLARVDSSYFNYNDYARLEAVTDIASISRGRLMPEVCKDAGSMLSVLASKKGENIGDVEEATFKEKKECWEKRYKLYERLLTESGGQPSTPFEFIPIQFMSKNIPCGMLARFSHNIEVKKDMYAVYTNMRTVLNFDITFMTNEPEEVEDFVVIVGRVPWKVISHLRTHRAFSFIVESSRNRKYLHEVQFWYPSWLEKEFKDKMVIQDMLTVADLKDHVEEGYLKPEEATMELSDRRLVLFAMAAWKQDKFAWDNLFRVRGKGTGTMSITNIVVENIKKLIL